jgi:intracellular septation protein
MKLLYDFFPIFLFFIAFKLFGIYIATSVTMLGSLLQVAVYWIQYRKFESLHLVTLAIVIVLGSTTLLLHNELFIKWKPTAIYWIFAFVFFGSAFIGKKPLIQGLLDKQITLPIVIWQRLNMAWVIFFMMMGIVNLYVLYHFSTNAWVNFKLFGALGMTIVFLIFQAIYMSHYLNKEQGNLPSNLPLSPPSKKSTPDES